MKHVNIYSPIALELWDKNTPLQKGIGGSETFHAEVAERLLARGHDVRNFAPIPKESKDLNWFTLEELPVEDIGGNWIVCRDTKFFDLNFKPEINAIFVAQDCDYDWTPQRLEKVSKYICLCKTHVQYTLQKYPQLKGKVYLSTNGVRSEYIRNLIQNTSLKRDPNKIIYSSSPDRGLLHILKNWFRIRERCPQAEIHVFYGFNNMESILARSGGNAWFVPMKNEIQELMNQKGVIFRGRVPQTQLYEEYLTSNIWYYPTDWPETSCINCMDAQACGVVPVTNRFWALAQNILNGYIYEGIPQKDPMCSALQVHKVCDLIENPWSEEHRREMMEDALDSFSWSKITSQFERWLQ